jgi:hypothetical protein
MAARACLEKQDYASYSRPGQQPDNIRPPFKICTTVMLFFLFAA